MYVAGVPLTERAATISDRRLGDRSKREAAERLEPQQWWQEERHDMQSNCACSRGRARDTGECLIGRRDEPSREGNSLRFVRLEDPIVRAAVQHRRKLPREVHGVADSRVHALSTDRTV